MVGLPWEEQREGAVVVTGTGGRDAGGRSLRRPLLLAFLSEPCVDRGLGGRALGLGGWKAGDAGAVS